MRPTINLLVLFIFSMAAGTVNAFTYWNDFRASALFPDDSLVIRVENPQSTGSTHTTMYDQDGVQEIPLSPIPDGQNTLEASVPGPLDGRRYYGFRYVRNDSIDLMSVRLADGANPAPDDLTRLSTDPVGDETYGLPHLDLTECRISHDGTRLFAALTNAGGGFPVNSGLTFFSYFLGIKNPAVTDPDTVFAMIQTVSAAGIIEPGLYRVFGTGVSDLLKIGEISATEYPAENTLLLSCQLADLEADPVFQSWYDAADPRLDVAGFTQRIALIGGVSEADRTPGGIWHLRDESQDPGPNQLPVLSDLVLPEPAAGGFVSIVYSDADGHCPVVAELVFDGNETYELRPQSLDYGLPVTYVSETDLPPLVDGSWSVVSARFSDNASDVVELLDDNVSAVIENPGLRVQASPNPFSGQTMVAFELVRSQPVKLAVFDLRGRHVTTLVDTELSAGSHSHSWDGCDHSGRPLPAGVYFYHLRHGGVDVVRRVTLVR
jgi:hypothetical protein